MSETTPLSVDESLRVSLEAYFFGWLPAAMPPGTFTTSEALVAAAEHVATDLVCNVIRPTLDRHEVPAGGAR